MGVEDFKQFENTETLSKDEMLGLFDSLKSTDGPVWKELYRASNNFGGPDSIRNLLEFVDEDMSKTQQNRVGELLTLLNNPALTSKEDIEEKVYEFISHFELV